VLARARGDVPVGRAWGETIPLKIVCTVAKYEPMGTTIIAKVKPRSFTMTSLKQNSASPSTAPEQLPVSGEGGRVHSRRNGGRDVGLLVGSVVLLQNRLFSRDDTAGCHGCGVGVWMVAVVGVPMQVGGGFG
jgi:hypothetical protein